MKNLLNAYINFFIKEKKQRRRVLTVLAMMAVFAGLTALWQLRVTGLAQTNDALCGVKEHVHTEDCITRELVCGQEETDGHIHTDDCYAVETVLACEEQHEHTENCYMHVRSLTCGQEECEAHHHTDDCYLAYYHCGYEAEHTHTEACYVDAGAQDDWEAELPEQTGIWAQDLLAVAQSQLGTEESQINYIKLEDGTRMGYTRYGAKFGAPYMQWDAAFVSFCLHYAGISEEIVPYGTEDMQSWADALNEQGMLFNTSEHSVQPGDAVLLRTSDEEQTAQTAGIVEKNENDTLTVIGRSANNVVEEQAYTADSVVGVVPVGEIQMELAATQNIALMMTTANDAPMARATNDLAGCIAPSVTIGDTTYETRMETTFNQGTGTFNTNVTLALSGLQAGTYQYEIPPEIVIPSDLIGKSFDMVDSNNDKAGTYSFVEKDGKCCIQLTVDQTYADTHTEIVGAIQFSGTMNKDGHTAGEKWTVDFSDEIKIEVDPNKVITDTGVTEGADISVSKWGELDRNTGKLKYGVEVSTIQGTDGKNIQFNDVLDLGNVKFQGDVNDIVVTVTDSDGQLVTQSLKVTKNQDGTYGIAGDLPALAAGKKYNISYAVPVSLVDNVNTQYSTTNKAKAEVTIDPNTTIHSEKELNWSDWVNTKPSKDGSYDKNSQKINWTITVNAGFNNIADKELRDEMFKDAQDLKVSPDNGYEWIVENGVKVGIRFIGDTNCNKYTITYSTDAEQKENKYTVSNTAHFGNQDINKGVEVPAKGGGGGGDQPSNNPTKECVGEGDIQSDGTRVLTWTYTHPEGILVSGYNSIVDILQVSQYTGWGQNVDADKHYMTREQANHVQEELTRLLKEQGVDSAAYTITFQSGEHGVYQALDKFEETAHLTHFKIYAVKDDITLSEPISFTYYSTEAPIDALHYQNDFAGTKAEHIYTGDKVVKSDGDGKTGFVSEVSKDGYVTWKVKIKLGDNITDKNNLTLNINDTLPKGVTLESLTFGYNQWGGNVNADAFSKVLIGDDGKLSWETPLRFELSGSYENNQMNIQLKPDSSNPNDMANALGMFTEPGRFIELTYTCKINNWDSMKYHQTITLPNTVEVTLGGKNYGTDTMTQKVEKVVDTLDKTHVWYSDHDENVDESKKRHLSYTVTINPEGKDLLKNSDILRLTDVITSADWGMAQRGEQVVLKTDTLHLYTYDLDANGLPVKGEDGKILTREITNWTWAYDNGWSADGGWKNTLTATVPDGMPLILQYDYSVAFKASGTPSSGNRLELKLNNEVTLEGDETNKDGDSTKGDEYVSQTVAIVDGGKQFKLLKVKEGDINTKLNDVTFTAYDKDGNEVRNTDGTVRTYTTNEQGELTVKREEGVFHKNTLYYLQETETRTGYKLPDDPPKFYFYWSEGNQKPEGWSDDLGATDLTKESKTITVPNEATDNYTLPATGGAGVLPIRLLGGGLLSAALALALLRRKHS